MENQYLILNEIVKLKKQAESLLNKNSTVIDCKLFSKLRNQLIQRITAELNDQKLVKSAHKIPEISTQNLNIKIVDKSGFLPTIFRQINRRSIRKKEIEKVLDRIANLELELKS